EYQQPSIRLDESVSMPVHEPVTTNSLIANLYSSKELDDKIDNETEWKDRSEKYPVLLHLAQKYLSVLATLVSSEQLFSDAGLHITALCNRLHPNMVEQMIFLKCNM
ncbi:25073_t:CDS:2, partial [Dentiscutata erythropus]